MRDVAVRAARRTSSTPAQMSIGEAPRVSRPFGASALEDEAVLDIPAYLRRSVAPQE